MAHQHPQSPESYNQEVLDRSPMASPPPPSYHSNGPHGPDHVPPQPSQQYGIVGASPYPQPDPHSAPTPPQPQGKVPQRSDTVSNPYTTYPEPAYPSNEPRSNAPEPAYPQVPMEMNYKQGSGGGGQGMNRAMGGGGGGGGGKPVMLVNPLPLHLLKAYPAVTTCPTCNYTGMTIVKKEVGSRTHLWAAVVCCFTCLGCIPYMFDDLKDSHHFCQGCGGHLVTFKD